MEKNMRVSRIKFLGKYWTLIKSSIFLITCVNLLFSQNINYVPITEKNTFMLIIDKSGSMSGGAIRDTKKGAAHFISQMEDTDRAGLISFSDGISVDVSITKNKQELQRGVNKISIGGGTKLYDALASGVKQLISSSGSRIIVYLTDGMDTGSNFSLRNLQSMFQGENIYVYGIGVGSNVDEQGLTKISDATGGDFHTVLSSNLVDLTSIYSQVLSSYYNNHSAARTSTGILSTGNLIVRSLPAGKVVQINGANKGMTPLKLTNLSPGNVDVEVYFEHDKLWKKSIEVKAGYTASFQARESEALKNLWVISKPHGATVFIGGEYVGYTSRASVNTKNPEWYEKVLNNPKELKVVGIKPGRYTIEIIGFPDFDYGPEQKVVVDYLLEGDDVLFVDIFRNVVQNRKGQKIAGKQRKDPFDF